MRTTRKVPGATRSMAGTDRMRVSDLFTIAGRAVHSM